MNAAAAPAPPQVPAAENAADYKWLQQLLHDEDLQTPRSAEEIKAEYYAINELIKYDSNAAYRRARTNLAHALHTQYA